MTATLKNTTQGYLLIVDEPIVGKILYSKIADEIGETLTDGQAKYIKDYDVKHLASIIAAENLEGVKGIALNVDDTLITDKSLVSDLLKEVSFEEVQATEHEEYWMVEL